MSEPEEQQDRISFNRTREPVRFLTAEDLLSIEAPSSGSESRFALQELEIEGLLSFGEKTHFALGQLNILIGPNGSGKSNLIDCVRLLCNAPIDIQVTFLESGFEDWLYKGYQKQAGIGFLQAIVKVPELADSIRHQIRLGPPRNSRAQLEEVIASGRADSEQADPYFVGSHRSEATLTFLGTAKRRRRRQLGANEYDPFQSILSQIRENGQYPEITRLASLYANFRIYSEWEFGRNSNLRQSTPINRSGTTLSETMNDLPLILNGLENTSAHLAIRDFLQELKETYRDYTTRIFFGRVGLELVEAPFELPVPAKRLSDGTLRFLALAAILLQPDPPSLICVEEPELGMHPDMIRMVAMMIVQASTKTQLIITTHSEHLLSALQDDFDALFAFDTGLAGSIVRRFSREEYEDWRDEHTLGELWTSGELGGNRW